MGGADGVGVELRDAIRLAPELRDSLLVREVAKQANRDRGRDDPEEDDPGEEEERQPDAQR